MSRAVGLLALALATGAACGGRAPDGVPVVACVGDSITLGVTRPAVAGRPIEYDALGGFPGRLQKLLGTRARVLNRGVGGSTAAQWLLRPSDGHAADFRILAEHAAPDGFPRVAPDADTDTIFEAILHADDPDVVVILLGANDLAVERSVTTLDVPGVADVVAARIDRLHGTAAAVAGHVLVSTILPNAREPGAWTDAANARIRERHPDHFPLAERFGRFWRQLVADGIHPSSTGHAAIAALLAAELEQRGLVAKPPVAKAAAARHGT